MKATQSQPFEPAASPLQQMVWDRLQEHGGKLSTDDIVGVLQEAIVRGIFAPGRGLRQDELAMAFGVSKIPVREALRTLQERGFVDLPPNRGAVVRELSLNQLREAFDLRQMLEPQLMRAAVPNLDEGTLQEAAALAERMEHESNAWAFSELNGRFHGMLYEAADKPLSLHILGMLQGHIQRMSFMQLSLAGVNRSSNDDHREILAACQARDSDEAARLVAAHVVTVKNVVLELYDQHYMARGPLGHVPSPGQMP